MFSSVDMPIRPTQARVDLGALVGNYATLKSHVGPQVEILAVVKADAYGHGAVPVARCLEAQGVSMLGVAIAEEALELRDAGLTAPILVLGQPLPSQVRALIEQDVRITVSDLALAEAVGAAARRAGIDAIVHVKVDTGMGRLGFLESDAVQAVQTIAGLERVRVEGLATHFSSATDEDPSFTCAQVDAFRAVLDELDRLGLRPDLVHAANSAALVTLPDSRFTLVRPGLALYGMMPSPEVDCPLALEPVMSLRTRVVLVKDLPAGRPVSYGRTFRTTRPTRTAVLTIGYDDGLPRSLSNQWHVRIRGRLCPVIGRICMDQCVVDVSNAPGVQAGDEAIVYETDRRSPLCIERAAERADTVPHELLCLIGRRVPRVYVDATGQIDLDASTDTSQPSVPRRAAG